MEQELRFWQGVAKVVEHATEIGLGDKKHEKGKRHGWALPRRGSMDQRIP